MRSLSEIDDATLDAEVARLEARIRKLRQISVLRVRVKMIESDQKPAFNGKIKAIVAGVCGALDVDESLVFSRLRTEDVTAARQVSAYIARRRGFSVRSIARNLDRDCGAIRHGTKSVQNRMDTEPKFKLLVEKIAAQADLPNLFKDERPLQ
jgi:chromosomal replication initiation ATPase DnaA